MKAKPLMVLNVVGMTLDLLRHAPNLQRLAQRGSAVPLGTVLPAVTCTAQSTLLTGVLPRGHGIVANGWYFRDLSEVLLWRQSNRFVAGERIYQTGKRRDPDYTTAKMFWWYNMYAPVEWSVTPRPSYPADGSKIFDSYSHPADLKDRLQAELGVFPLFKFWGPTANIESSRWIAEASLRVFQQYSPSLTLVYLPHLDYNLQRLGPDHPAIAEDVRLVDAEAAKLIDAADQAGAEVVVLSEYAITAVNQPIHINRVLREAGLLVVRQEPTGWETLDCGASTAFAVADHQVAHVYVNDPARIAEVEKLLAGTPGIDAVYNQAAQHEWGLDHERSGELVAVAAPGAWFTYYFWLDDAVAPDYARTVDIHRKPGYDPVELFVDPQLKFPKLRIARRLAQKFLGMRYLMDVIGLDASIVRGSHGRLPSPGKEVAEAPVFIIGNSDFGPRIEAQREHAHELGQQGLLPMTSVKQLLLELQFGRDGEA